MEPTVPLRLPVKEIRESPLQLREMEPTEDPWMLPPEDSFRLLMMEQPEDSRRLGDEEIMEILLRLPVKDITRCKVVCTRWLSLIASRFFISSHLKRSISDPSSHYILLHDARSSQPIPPDPSNPVMYCLFPKTKIVGSINGLICIVGLPTDSVSPDDIWIWNPSTRHSKKLPFGKPTSRAKVTFAFCWDFIADDYKLVKIVSKPEATFGEVWASSSDRWQKIEVHGHFFYPHCIASVTACDVVAKGIAYWIVMDYHQNLFVASFDVTTRAVKLMSMPKLSLPHESVVDCVYYKYQFLFATNWKENFALAEWDAGYPVDSPFDIYHLWTMDGGVGKEVWSKKLSFSIHGHFSYCMNTINGKFVLKGGAESLVLYDVETREAKALGEPEMRMSVSSVYGYVGSLVSIKGFKPLGEDMTRLIKVVWP